MRLIVGIGIGFVYLVVGYVTTIVIAALEGEDVGEEIESFGVWMLWPLLILMYVLMKLIPWVGKKVAVLPVMIAVWIRLWMDEKAEKKRAKEVREILKVYEKDGNKGTGKFKG